MADSFTTNLNMTKPEVGASADTWGAKSNSDDDVLDAMLGGVIFGLTLSTAGSSGTFGIAAGAASGMTLGSAYTKTTSAWAVGTGNGGIDTGAVANSTWYHVHLIQRIDTGVVDALFSLSATSPTLPASYTRARRIGAMKTDGSAHWGAFTQIGEEFLWNTAVGDFSSTIGTAASTQALSVPTGVNVRANISGYGQNASGGVTGLISSPLVPDVTPNAVVGNVTFNAPAANQGAAFNISVFTDTSANIRMRADTATTSLNIVTRGWVDARGKN